MYPKGPYRPESAVQRGSTQFLPIYPGDPETPGIASTPDLPADKRIPADKLQSNQPSIPVNPLSYKGRRPDPAGPWRRPRPRANGREACPSPITSAALPAQPR